MAKKARNKTQKKIDGIEINLPWYVWAAGILIILGIVLWITFSNMGTFVYKGLAFTKESYGKDLIIYHYAYNFVNRAGENVRYNMYIHTDPRKNSVPLDADIKFDSYNVKLSVDAQALTNCSESRAAVGELTQFIVFNDLNISVGTPDLEQANKFNVSVMYCGTHRQDVMILIKTGNQSRVYQQDKCYTIEVADCQVFAGVEKFMVEAVAQAKEEI